MNKFRRSIFRQGHTVGGISRPSGWRRVSVLAVAGVLLLPMGAAATGSPSGATVEGSDASGPHDGQGDSSSVSTVDLESMAYAEQFGVTLDETSKRFQRREAMQALIAEALKYDPSADIWFEVDQERQTLNIRSDDKDVARGLALEQDVNVHQEPSVGDSLTAYVDGSTTQWMQEFPNIMGISSDVRDASIYFDVWDSSYVEGSVLSGDALGRYSELAVGAPYRISVVIQDRPSGDSNRGGLRMSTCTTGFSAYNSSYSRGLLTAAHCGYQDWYANGSSTANASTLRASNWGANADIQFRSISVITHADYWTGAAYVPVNGTRTVYPGDYTCGRGKSSGFRCGIISSTTYKPTWSGACNGVVCNSVFVSVPVGQTGGDSGGPWFSAGYAHGIHKGGSSSFSVYSKIGYRPSGVVVKTT